MTEEIAADYCVVGAGIAGLLVASKLAGAKPGKKVVVLDQGPDIREADRTALFAKAKREFAYEADYNDGLGPDVLTPTSGGQAQRLFGTGGTALHFGGWMVRPIEDDLRVRTRFGYGRDWPLAYRDLEPWLARAERETGVPGIADNPYVPERKHPYPMPAHAYSYFDRTIFGPALNRLGMKGHCCPFAVTSEAYEQEYGVRSACAGCRFCKFCPTGARYSPDKVHGAWLRERTNASIRNGISLRRLEVSADGSRILAAHAKTVTGREAVIVRAQHFVLAMGGVATPRMLLLSDGPGHQAGLGNAGGQLGVGYNGHLNSIAVMEVDRHVGGSLGFPTMQCDHGRRPKNRREERSWILMGGPLDPGWLPGTFDAKRYLDGDQLSLARIREALPRMVFLLMMHELSGRGTLDLDPERTDAFGDRIARIHLPWTEEGRRAAKTFGKIVDDLGREMHADGTKTLRMDPVCFYGHPSGASAMGATPDQGVCDENLKVFGVENLFLCSNSVFPHMGANPPTLTIAALALRLASHLEARS